MSHTIVAVAGMALLMLSACTSSQSYELVRDAGQAKARCEQELTVEAQRECEAAYQRSYQNYRAERREVLEGDGVD